MREHKQILERGRMYIPGEKEKAEQRALEELKRLQDLYGDRIVEIRQGWLNELFVVDGMVGYIINVWIDLPEREMICLPGGLMLAYETD